jgi:hypothetical protein
VAVSFRIERGEPDDPELAALLVALTALVDRPAPAPPPAASGWADRSWRGGQDAWRLSTLLR